MDSRRAFLEGADIVSRLVKSTYGPYGRNVLIERFAGIVPTKDGATVVREAGDLRARQNAAIQVIQEACIAVEQRAGDGTSTTALLATEILRHGLKMTVAGFCPMQLNSELQKAARTAVDFIYEVADRDLTEDQILRIAAGASKGDEKISEAVMKAVMEIGENGNVLVQEGQGVDIEIEFREGVVIDKGYSPPYAREHEHEVEGCFVAIFKQPLSTIEDIRDCLETVTQWPQNSLIIFSPRVQGEALKTINLNMSKRGPLHTTSYQQKLKDQMLIPISMKTVHEDRSGILEDLAALTGATVIDRNAGHDPSKFDPEWYGTARKVKTSLPKTEIIAYPEADERIEKRILELNGELSRCQFDHDRDRLQERIAALDGGLCLLKVGGYTEMEVKERMSRVEDAVLATSTALRTGVVPGAGNTLLEASRQVDDSTMGGRILRDSLREPTRILVESRAPGKGSVVVSKIDSLWTGWDPVEKRMRDFRESPQVIDAAASVAEAVRAAASVAGMLLTTEVFVPKGAK